MNWTPLVTAGGGILFGNWLNRMNSKADRRQAEADRLSGQIHEIWDAVATLLAKVDEIWGQTPRQDQDERVRRAAEAWPIYHALAHKVRLISLRREKGWDAGTEVIFRAQLVVDELRYDAPYFGRGPARGDLLSEVALFRRSLGVPDPLGAVDYLSGPVDRAPDPAWRRHRRWWWLSYRPSRLLTRK